MRDEFLWVEKYRPKTIEDCILPEATKKTFLDFLDKGEVPNLLLAGPAGCGKTTVAKALCNQLGVDVYVINGSDEGRFLDTVRNNAKNFASTVSLSSEAKHKVIIIDEADNTTPDVQLLLRASIEEFSGNCRFIFTCNYKNKIIEPLHSPGSWTPNGFKVIRKSYSNSSISTSQTGVGSSTSAKDILLGGKLMLEYSPISQTLR